MRAIDKIILHCSASDAKNQTAKMIDGWHRARGWDSIGYHYFIRKNGLIEGGRYVEEVGAHVRGQNTNSIGICLAGDMRFCSAQFRSLEALLLSLQRVYPEANVYGHNEFTDKKTCPNFAVSRFKRLYNEGELKWSILVMLEKLWKRFSRS